jgi:hypothetical protein
MTGTSGGGKTVSDNQSSLEIAAGATLGLFVGSLLGLSLGPGTTSTFLGGFVAMLTAFFGLASATGSLQFQVPAKRIIGFCLAALVATPIAVSVRTHNLLAPSPSPPPPATPGIIESTYKELMAVGFKETEARDLISKSFAIPLSGQPGVTVVQPTPTLGGTLGGTGLNFEILKKMTDEYSKTHNQ